VTLRFDSSASGMQVIVYRFMCIVLLVSPLEAESDTLTLSKEGPKTAYEGDLIEYSLEILNTGGSAIEGIEVLDALPVEVDFVDATPTPDGMYNPVTGAWTLPALGTGEQDNTAGLTIQALVGTNLSADTATFVSTTNRADIVAPILPEPITAEVTTNIVCAFCIDWEILSVKPDFEGKVDDDGYKDRYLFYVKVINNGPVKSEATVRATHFSISGGGGGYGNVGLSPAEPVAVSLDAGEIKTLTYSTNWQNGPESDYKVSWEFEINDASLMDPILPNTASGSFNGDVKGGSGGGGCTISEQKAIDTLWLFFLILCCIRFVSVKEHGFWTSDKLTS
jgi:uncharacterized repeat protein (TIGR01451 family)